ASASTTRAQEGSRGSTTARVPGRSGRGCASTSSTRRRPCTSAARRSCTTGSRAGGTWPRTTCRSRDGLGRRLLVLLALAIEAEPPTQHPQRALARGFRSFLGDLLAGLAHAGADPAAQRGLLGLDLAPALLGDLA